MKFLNPPFYIYFFIHIKISETFLSKHYQDKKKNDFKKKLAKSQNLFRKEKEKRQQYGHARYKNLSENEKQSLLSIEKKIIE